MRASDVKHCRLSRKGLTSDTVQKAFKLFVNAEMVDVSHNQISFLRSDLLPSSIITLDLSHNLFTRIMGMDRLVDMTHLNLRFAFYCCDLLPPEVYLVTGVTFFRARGDCYTA